MAYIIYNMKTFQLYSKPGHYGEASYKTERSAKANLTKLKKASKLDDEWKVMDYARFRTIEPEVEVTSLNGNKTKIRASDKGCCCDPSTERYWSM